MTIVLLWIGLMAIHVIFQHRLLQNGGDRGSTGNALLLGAALIVAITLALGNWIHAIIMVVAWLGLSFVTGPLVAAVFGKPSRHAAPTAAGRGIDKLDRGEISLHEYFTEAKEEELKGPRKLQELSGRRDIAAVLSKHGMTLGHYKALREQLSEVPELEWQILASPRELTELIALAAAGKSPALIGRAFNSRLRKAG